MKTAYFIVTIPAGEYTVKADTTNGRKLEYMDFFDRAMLYRYFDPGACWIERIPAREGRERVKRSGTAETFQSMRKFGSFR